MEEEFDFIEDDIKKRAFLLKFESILKIIEKF